MGSKLGVSDEDITARLRKSRRKSAALPCALKIMGKVYPGRLLDISSGGAFVQTAHFLACGAEFSIIFKAQARHKPIYLNLKARVVYAGRFLQGFKSFYGFGARFIDLSPDNIAKLEEVLDAIKSDPERKYELTM
jgi:hypothetical protein